MILIFILCIVLVVIIIVPSQILPQTKAIFDVQSSLDVRLSQLKKDFQFRTKELARRLRSDDLAEEEWQHLTDELAETTRASITSTKLASSSSKTNSSWFFVLILIFTIIVIAATSYKFSGSFEQVEQQISMSERLTNDAQTIKKLTRTAESEKSQQALNELYLALRTNVERLPDDVSAWRELALFNASYGRLDEARAALNIAIDIEPSNVELKVDLAQILTLSKSKDDIILSLDILNKVLQTEAEHQGALYLLANIYYQFRHYEKSIASWNQLLRGYATDSEMTKLILRRINDARQMMAGKTEISDLTKPETESNQASQSSLQIKIIIPEAIRSKLTGKESIFVFAKAIEGPPFPIAVIKTTLDALTDVIVLTDANAMRPDAALSKFDKVQVTVRISLLGGVTAQKGDIQGQSDTLTAPFNTSMTITVDQEVM